MKKASWFRNRNSNLRWKKTGTENYHSEFLTSRPMTSRTSSRDQKCFNLTCCDATGIAIKQTPLTGKHDQVRECFISIA